MRRNAQMRDFRKERMSVGIERTGEQRINPRAAKFPGGRLILCTTSKEGLHHPGGNHGAAKEPDAHPPAIPIQLHAESPFANSCSGRPWPKGC
jgi:hypothetical protein